MDKNLGKMSVLQITQIASWKLLDVLSESH